MYTWIKFPALPIRVIVLSSILLTLIMPTLHAADRKSVYLNRHDGEPKDVDEYRDLISGFIKQLSFELREHLTSEAASILKAEVSALLNLEVEPYYAATTNGPIDLDKPKNLIQEWEINRHEMLQFMWGRIYTGRIAKSSVFLGDLGGDLHPPLDLTVDLDELTLRNSWQDLKFITTYALSLDALWVKKNRRLAQEYLRKAVFYANHIDKAYSGDSKLLDLKYKAERTCMELSKIPGKC